MLIGYVVQTCCNSSCGISFAVPSEWDRCKRNDHTTMWCPNGHQQSYKSESDEQRLKRELAKAQSNVEWYDNRLKNERSAHDHTKNRLNATRGVVTRIKNRVGHGVCPCCSRTFGNLASHMKSKHADYAKSDAVQIAAE